MPHRERLAAVPGGARIFHRLFTRLGCPGRPPQFSVEFYPYAGLSHTIRVSGDTAQVRLSDHLRGARLRVLEAVAAVLLARLYRRPLPPPLAETYRKFAATPAVERRLRRTRLARGRHCHSQPQGTCYDLARLFAGLNRRYFAGRLHRPRLGWSLKPWRARLGYFDPTLDLIVLNRRLDREDVPRYAVEYVLYHEMLHVKHPRRVRRGGCCGFQVHSPSFRRAEKRYAACERAERFLRRLA
jgi:hypothetical protein